MEGEGGEDDEDEGSEGKCEEAGQMPAHPS